MDLTIPSGQAATEPMSQEISFSRFVFFDTNIISNLAKDPSLWGPLQDFLYRDDLCIAVSGPLAAELSSAPGLHGPVNDLLTSVPSALIKTADLILDEEVQAHPQRRSETLMQFSLNQLYGTQDFARYLSSPELAEAREGQHVGRQVWTQRLEDQKSNFPPSKTGKHKSDQADLFAWCLTIQQLAGSHPEFMQRFKNDVANFKAEVFPSAQIMGYALFYKYYLAGLTPKDSDFGDMFHLHAMPYCKLVVVERNMCEVLKQIKRNHKALDGVVLKNLKFLKDWNWTEER
jgi:hypothetical protein